MQSSRRLYRDSICEYAAFRKIWELFLHMKHAVSPHSMYLRLDEKNVVCLQGWVGGSLKTSSPVIPKPLPPSRLTAVTNHDCYANAPFVIFGNESSSMGCDS